MFYEDDNPTPYEGDDTEAEEPEEEEEELE